MRKYVENLKKYMTLTRGQRVGVTILALAMGVVVAVKWLDRPVPVDVSEHKRMVDKFRDELANPPVEAVYRKSGKNRAKPQGKSPEKSHDKSLTDPMQEVPAIGEE